MSTEEETTSRGPRRRPAPEKPSQHPQLTDQENRSLPGWPSFQKGPFIPDSYYRQFAPRLRPKFEPGTPLGESFSMAEAERILDRGDAWNMQMMFKTAINNDDREVVLPILGPGRGETVFVTIPPFGVLRAPVEAFSPSEAGAIIQRYHPVSYTHLTLPTILLV